MKRKGVLPKACQAPLLLTAAFVDLSFIVLVTVSIYPFVAPYLHFAPVELRGLLLFLALTPVGWIMFDLVFGGNSPGRWVLGLEICDSDTGKAKSFGQRSKRATLKIGSLGLSGLSPVSPSYYDRKTNTGWRSPIAPRPTSEWILLFNSGQYQGLRSRLGKIPAFRDRKCIRIGRDKSWADIVLDESGAGISSRHCVIYAEGFRIILVDGDGQGRPSSNGTVVNGSSIAPGSKRVLTGSSKIAVAGVRFELIH